MVSATRRSLTAGLLALAALAAGSATAHAASRPAFAAAAADVPAAPTNSPAQPVPFEEVAAVDTVGTAGLARGVAIRIGDADDLARLEHILEEATASHTTGTEDPATEPGAPSTRRAVIDAIAAAYPEGLPAGSALLVGLVSGCSPSPGVVRLADDEVMLVDAGSDPDVVCAIAHTIVAVVEVSADDVPVGGADRATLRQFGFVGYRPEIPAGDVGLPPVADGDRRITALVSGCQDTTAELVVSEASVEAVAKNDPGEPEYHCVRAEWFVAVFDIDAGLIPDTAEVPSDTGGPAPTDGGDGQE